MCWDPPYVLHSGPAVHIDSSQTAGLLFVRRIWLKDPNGTIKRDTRAARGIAMKLLQASCFIMALAAGAAESAAESAAKQYQ